MHASTSDVSDRASPQTCDERPRPTTALTLWRSVSEDAGKPASMTCTPSFESCSAIASFSSSVNEMPGVCSPSRSVVSKTVTFFFAWLSVKKAVRFSVSRCFSVCRFHTYSLSAKVYKEFGQPAGGLRRPSKIGPVNLHRHRPRSTPRIFLQRQHSGERWGRRFHPNAQGAIIHRYGAIECIHPPPSRREPHRRSCLSPCARLSGQSPNTCPPRLAGGGGL